MFGNWQGTGGGASSSAANDASDTPGQQRPRPSTPRNRLLKSLYARAMAARLSEPSGTRARAHSTSNDSTSSASTTGSTAHNNSNNNHHHHHHHNTTTAGTSPVRSASSSTYESPGRSSSSRTNYAMFGNLRRTNPIPTVEIARPAPEVEFSRVADSMYPVLDPYASPGNSVSLLSLRASQNPSYSGLAAHSSAASMSSSRAPSVRASAGADGRGSSLGFSTPVPLARGGTEPMDAASVSGVNGLASPGSYAPQLARFDDEHDVPFRTNAVEIAAQDDKSECAFLPGASSITGITAAADDAPGFSNYGGGNGSGVDMGDYIRSQTALWQSLGTLQPVTLPSPEMSAAVSDLPDADNGGYEMKPRVAISNQIFKDLHAIAEFNRQARERVHTVEPGEAMAQFPMRHTQKIIRQLLEEIDVDDSRGWDDVVLRLVTNAITHVRPNVAGGDRMDLRNYVRIKRIPGGSPSDSQYISGLVFTKGLAHKRMPRYIKAPRIMLLTLPLEYSDIPHAPASRYVSFDTELRMQQGFSEKLVQRITSAAPDLVFTEKLMPRNVLESLMRNNIAVAHGIKRSVIRAIARCTGAEVVTSMSKFSDYPRIGTCRALAVQTFEDQSIPEFRKSFIFLDGCSKDLGGTIVLRGELFPKLREIKQVVDLVVCLAYSMLLETALLANEYVLAVPGDYDLAWSDQAGAMARAVPGTPKPEDESLALEALNEYNIVLSSSPCVRIPPPQVLVSMRQKELAIRSITEKFNKMSTGRKELALPMPVDSVSGAGNSTATGVSFLVSRQQSAASAKRVQQQYGSEIVLHENYIREGKQFLKANPYAVSLWDYQGLVIAYMLTCRKHDYMMCVGPEYHLISYYDYNTDVTLGQYLEMCFDLSKNCPVANRRCAHPLYEHRHSYIHYRGKLDVTVDEFPCPVERLSEVMLMWGVCKNCGKRTPVTRMSDESWRYSFGKYLETSFYNDVLRPRACVCPHDSHQDYVRCFSLRNMVTRFSYSLFPIWSVSMPTMPLYFNVEVSIGLKNQEAAELRERLDKYYQSLMSRLEAFPLDVVYEEKIEECRHTLGLLSARAATEQVYFQQTLEQTLRNTHPADTLVIVVVYEALQGKVVEWNLRFSELVQSFIQLDAATNKNTVPKRSNTGGNDTSGAPTEPTALTRASTFSVGVSAVKKDEIDSLNVIDDLRSISHNQYQSAAAPGGDLGAQLNARLEMPRLGTSPTDEKFELSSQYSDSSRNTSSTSVDGKAGSADQRSIVLMQSLRPRLHRKLSMEMMKRDRERQERLQEKMRRPADAFNARGTKYLRQLQRANMSAAAQAQSQMMTGEQAYGQGADAQQQSALVEPLDRPLRHVPSGIPTGRYSTTRLIGGIATDVDDVVRIPQPPVFPELRGRSGKPVSRFSSLFGNKGVRPLLDILGDSTPELEAGKGSSITTTTTTATNRLLKDNLVAEPSRIPGIRTQAQQQQQQKHPQRRDSDASSRPLSSFGRPPNANHAASNIPRPPNIRSRAASPTESEANRPASVNSGGPTAKADGGVADHSGKAASNVFLRLAKRLNSAKGQGNNSATLGTVPRRMNLLLPATAQYVSQTQPRRTTVSQTQAQVPVQPKRQIISGADGASYKRTPPRRHSYQLPPNAREQPESVDDDWYEVAYPNDYEQEDEHFISSKPSSGTMPGSGRYDNTGEYGEQGRWQPHSVIRHRSATMSQVQPRPGGSGHTTSATPAMAAASNTRHDERTQPQSTWRPPAPPHRLSEVHAAEPQRTQASDHEQTAPEQKPSMASRASGLIPNITRRLGLGFGFRSSQQQQQQKQQQQQQQQQQQRSLSGSKSAYGSANTSDVEVASSGSFGKKQRVSSSGNATADKQDLVKETQFYAEPTEELE
ncbi:Mitochondrial distribution and morphology protein 12 [Coemansia sp. RSA 1804]|nr:Mitochondrial distribution and morphology protein 12 [Coemansia sp. RSA 1804]